MTRINSLLEELDIRLDEQTLAAFDEHFHDAVYTNVVDRVIKTLDHDQVEQLAQLRSTGSDHAWEWLKQNVPDLDIIITEEIYMVIGDVIEESDSI